MSVSLLRRSVPWLWLALAACSGNVLGAAERDGSQSGSADGGDPDAPFVAFESLVRRHSRAELDLTLRDLLGDQSGPATRFLAEDEFAPYDNDYPRQLASQALVDSLEALAQDAAARALASPAQRAALVPCTPSGARDEACFRQTLQQLGRRAFRRALSQAELDAYLPLLELAATPPAGVKTDFYTAIELALRAILQDPEFLYRIEVGTPRDDVRALDGYEIAARLSYLLWGSTPDDELLRAAEEGELADAAGRRAQAQRLLDDSRARAQLARFHAMWLGYRAIPHTPELTTAFAAETAALIERVVFDEQRDYLDLFRLEETFIDAQLARHYGLPPPGGAAQWVSYGDTGRAGILSHGSVLSAFSKFSDTSPTQRGILVRTRLMCDAVDPPPANINTDEPPSAMDADCKVERYEEHRASVACANCHAALD
ncbi:MAG TPA: DUF1592 domain-containing protein, partial [Polyangiales bacterium]